MSWASTIWSSLSFTLYEGHGLHGRKCAGPFSCGFLPSCCFCRSRVRPSEGREVPLAPTTTIKSKHSWSILKGRVKKESTHATFVCVHVCCVHECMHVHTCGKQKLLLGVFLNFSPLDSQVGSISRWVWSSPVWPSLVTHPIPIPIPQGQSIVCDFLNAGIQAAAMAAQPSCGVQRSKQLSVSRYLLSHLPNSKFCFIPSFPLEKSGSDLLHHFLLRYPWNPNGGGGGYFAVLLFEFRCSFSITGVQSWWRN